MSRDRASIGTSPCPLKDCDQGTIPVYAYNSNSDAKRARFAGRVFGMCPNCGRVEQSSYLQKHLTRADDASGNAAASPDASSKPAHASPPVATTRKPTAARVARAGTGAAAARTSRPSSTAPEPARSSWLPDFWSTKK